MDLLQVKKLAVVVAGAFVAIAGTSAFADPIVTSNTRPDLSLSDVAGMQSILNSVYGCTGCVDAITGQQSTAEWQLLGSLSVATAPIIKFELAGFASSNTMGIWSGTDSTAVTSAMIFDGAAGVGDVATVVWLTDTSGTITNSSGTTGFSGIDRNGFGFYLSRPGEISYIGYSADSLNGGVAQMLSYQQASSNRWVMGFEDTYGGDRDFNDFVFSTESVTAVPEPETYAMLLAGLGLMGFVARRRQRKLAAA